ncbi:MAG: LacI family transcriptional regulator [Bifidobacteriaceae bacterium]|jgi:LacI family transcriptional regulator|nr:LacI family transcriptional regulator [Bifidobacteriaceae bacterium]
MNSGRAGRVTLDQVATAANVSVATASKVLNARSGVSPTTRDRVLATMTQLGYRLTTARSADDLARAVQLVFDSLDGSPYSAEILQGFVNAAREMGLIMHLDTLRPSPQPKTHAAMDAWAAAMVGSAHLGLVFITCDLGPEEIEACKRLETPFIALDPRCLLDSGIVTVGSTNFGGGFAATQHLLELGHRDIGLIAGLGRTTFAQERAYGFRSALADAGVACREDLIRMGDFTYDSGLELGGELLDVAPRPTAIVVNCDTSAIGVIEAARRRRVRVPEDLSVVGFDDTKLALWSTPQLTTVRQPLGDMARVALRTVAQMAAGQQPDSPHTQLATTLVVRGSTARPPARRR